MDVFKTFLLPRAGQYEHCTLATCPVSDSLYGYLPSEAVNMIFVVLFATSCIGHILQGVMNRSWTFMIAFGIGTATEAVGYVGRIQMRSNPWTLVYSLFALQVPPHSWQVDYLTLKHIIVYGSPFSRIAPKWYTWILIFCDILPIFIQFAGAVIASSGTHISLGNDVMMTGLVFQVVTLGVFGALAADVYFRIRKYRGELNDSTKELGSSGRFKYFLIAMIISYACTSIRCVYRIAEMAGGWRNKIMENEPAFVVLDGVMSAVAVLVMNFFHPGFLFKQSYATLKTERMAPELEMRVESVQAN